MFKRIVLVGLLVLLSCFLTDSKAHAGDCEGGVSPSDVDIIEDLYNAFAAGDTDTIVAIIHKDVVWIESEGIPYGGTFIGQDGVFEGVFAKIADERNDLTAMVVEGVRFVDGEPEEVAA